jgi:signal transduction histidine kinase
VTVLRRRAAAVAVDEIDVHVAVALGRSDQPVLLLDRDRSARWANEAAERLYGDALVPFARMESLVEQGDAGRVADAIARVSAAGSESIDVRLRATGREVELFFSASRLGDGDDVVLVLARDVEAEPSHGSAVASRARQSAAVAAALTRHGIAALGRLERESLEQPGQAVASYVSREAALLERLDRFSRPRLDRVVEPLELNRIVEAAIEATRPRFEGDARERGVAYDVQFEPCRTARALGNANELRDAFVELIANAIEAQPAGGRVEIKTIERGGLVGVRVRDAGDGMTDDVRARAFDPLFTTKGARLGLGLSFAHGAVLRHGGRLSVRSAPGEGSSFQIVLPAFEGAGEGDEVGAAHADALVLVSDRLRRLRILDQLEDAGVSAVWASDTREVVWALDLHKPRALVLDRGAFYDHGDRLVAIVRAAPERLAVLIVDHEIPEPAAVLTSLPNVRLATLDEVARLVR